jgi:hypothetical protein
VSACRFSKAVKADGEPYEIAYWYLSFFMAVNLISLLMLIRYFVGFEIVVNKYALTVIFAVPPFVLNYFVFLKRKKYKRILAEIEAPINFFIYYLVFTFLFFIVSGYLIIP